MKTINNQTETTARRSRFEFDPERHYVLVQRPDTNWDGPQLDRLMDEEGVDGGDAYRVEADGGKDAGARRITGHRNMVMLSCSKDHIDQKIRDAAKASTANAYTLKPSADAEEKLSFGNAISIDDIPSKVAALDAGVFRDL